ncbi:uncharacterized protein FA14DRAFT_18924 [Meira miltonrushii]|uniref:Uncharacterized protein n=1 Tax=Meira miltonrushii TaxID=1280837 RepID=A0A316VJT5_9BASI|nr:uncharacterized protein FA14DRAFT_18924 [Meira miltonrushii]PWN37770.1 hypothetical protein FA14DRAFT_18924 [Meira miltonrushii]
MAPVVDQLLARVASTSTQLPPLQVRKTFDNDLTPEIDSFAKQNSPDRPCVRAALHILNDDIDRAHKICQDNEGDPSTDLCHAILHRREGDFWNSKLWYRLIKHPLIDQVHGGTTGAQSFVDNVELIVAPGKRSGPNTPCAAGNLDTLKRKQADELEQLVQYVLKG